MHLRDAPTGFAPVEKGEFQIRCRRKYRSAVGMK
jgi:hypothetical protein